MRQLLILFLICFHSVLVSAQESLPDITPSPPIPAEFMIGSDRLTYQIVVNKSFSSKSKFGFLSVSTFAVDYKNDKSENDYMTPAFLNYRLIGGFGLTSGVAVNSNWGFRPFNGLQYVFANRKILALIVSGFYLTESHNFETLALIEFKPKFNNEWALYSRLQVLVSQNMEYDNHDRSYVYGRLGVSYKSVGFGLGTNLDWYGPAKISKENYGIFVRYEFQ